MLNRFYVYKYMITFGFLFTLAILAWAKAQAPTEADYKEWAKTNGTQVEEYLKFLGASGVPVATFPLHQLLRTASDWRKCKDGSPFAVPPKALWPNMVQTLKLLDKLIVDLSFSEVEIFSVDRDATLNKCVGGASSSAHIDNIAIDFLPKNWDASAKVKVLCDYWKKNGKDLKFGLGFYPSGRLHVDTKGFRTWGSDFTSETSPCK